MNGPSDPTSHRSGGIPLPMAPAADSTDDGQGPDRRTVLKWMALAAAAPAVTGSCTPDASQGDAPTSGAGTPSSAAGRPTSPGNPRAAGTPWDPDLVSPVRPWDLVLGDEERATLAVLCDAIIPADEVSPAASTVGAVDYIDEWVSAPYEGQKRDLVLVRGGVAWLEREAVRRFGAGQRFTTLTAPQIATICDDICWIRRASPEHRMAARFFAKVRDLTATAFYTTPEGMADIGYVGNTALARWDAPPPEVLRHLGLA